MRPARSWQVLAKGKGGEGHNEGTAEGKRQGQEQSDATDLIKPARWSIPAYPLKTLYRSMLLPGRTLDDIDSSIPGMVRIVLTTPVYDKFNYDEEILAKGSIVIATQVGRPTYGNSRLELKLDQIETPSGEVIALKSMVGDDHGAQGLTGRVNNHIGKLVLATGLSALLNIGIKSAAGTPGRGQYYQDPVQSATQDIGQSVQRDAQSIVDRELRIPPTITVKSGTFCTIGLLENVTFSKKPVVAP
jgi:type IV secretion system protein VirB10